jgi:hypothetical protein
VKSGQFLFGIVCLVVAAVFALVGMTEVLPAAGKITVAIYPAAFFALVGVIQVFRSLFKYSAR